MKKLETPLTDADAIIYEHDPSAKWVWQANEGACKKCTDLDGQKFSYNDIPHGRIRIASAPLCRFFPHLLHRSPRPSLLAKMFSEKRF